MDIEVFKAKVAFIVNYVAVVEVKTQAAIAQAVADAKVLWAQIVAD